MLWVVLAMGLLTHLSLRQVYKHARRMVGGQKTPGRSSLCEARQRLGVEPVRCVFERVVRPLAVPTTPGAFYKGLRLMGIDGTVQDTPDTPANAARFERSSGGRGDGAFPQLRKLSLVELGTHIEVALTVGGWQDSEQKLVERLWDKIPTDALLMEDRGFFSYDHWKTLDTQGVKLLVRIKNHLVLKPIRHLSDGSFEAKIYPSSYDRGRDRNGVLVRVIEYTIQDPQRTGHGETHRLMTNLFDGTHYPASELACLYHERWEEELVFDEQKTHLDPRRAGKPAHFRSQTPAGVEQEVYALSLGHFVVRALMLEAAKTDKLDGDRLSFTGCLRILQARLPECESSRPVSLEQWYRLLLEEMAQERIEPRRSRTNPRVVKRKMSKFAKKRPEHRGRPPLKKTFAESVVIT
jgi:DDE family transposase/transposase IS4-like protein